MKVPKEIMGLLEKTLEKSIQEGNEKLGLLVYYPKEDSIKGIVLAEYLESRGLTCNSDNEVRLEKTLFENLIRFNSGLLDRVVIDDTEIKRGNGLSTNPELIKVILYHTHPHEEQDIFPSKEDRDYAASLGAPAVVVGSKRARDFYGLPIPFVALYTKEGTLNFVNTPISEKPTYKNELGSGEHTTQRPINVIEVI